MSYLRGPLTKDQIRTLMAGRKPAASVADGGTSCRCYPQLQASGVAARGAAGFPCRRRGVGR